MTASLEGSISFLSTVSDEQSADVLWLCTITSRSPAFPEIEVRRLRNGRLDKRGGRLRLLEANEEGSTADGAEGMVALQLTGKPKAHADRVVWHVKLAARPGGPGVTFELLGRLGDGEKATLASLSSTSLTRPQLNSTTTALLRLTLAPVPRLSVGINEASPPARPDKYRGLEPGPGNAADAREARDADIRALLYRIFFLLDAPNSLDPVWDQQSLSITAQSLSEENFKADPVRVAEELWARQVAEMLCFTGYGGPAVGYGNTVTDTDLISEGVSRGATNPRYGLVFACQHLATFGVASRGLHTFAPGGQLGAGATSAAIVKGMGGEWLAGADGLAPIPRATNDPALLMAGPLEMNIERIVAEGPNYGPGSVHLFSNRRARPDQRAEYEEIHRRFRRGDRRAGSACTIVTVQDNRGRAIPKELCVKVRSGALTPHVSRLFQSPATGELFLADQTPGPGIPHIGFCLRASKRRAQLLDTGGFSIQGRNVTALSGQRGGFHTGNLDEPPTGTLKGTHPYRGTGVFPRPGPDEAKTLRDHVLRILRKARPLGLARLLLVDRAAAPTSGGLGAFVTSGALVYASPLLTMYFNGTDAESEVSNYSIARYLWSLRDLPGREDLEAIWALYVPQGQFAVALRDAGRGKTALQVAEGVFGSGPGLARAITGSINLLADVVSRPGGSVVVLGPGGRSKPHAIHHQELRDEHLVPMDKVFFKPRAGERQSDQDFASYFQG